MKRVVYKIFGLFLIATSVLPMSSIVADEVNKTNQSTVNSDADNQKAIEEANKHIEEAKKEAEEAGVNVTTTDKQNYDKADDALADAEAQKQKLE